MKCRLLAGCALKQAGTCDMIHLETLLKCDSVKDDSVKRKGTRLRVYAANMAGRWGRCGQGIENDVYWKRV